MSVSSSEQLSHHLYTFDLIIYADTTDQGLDRVGGSPRAPGDAWTTPTRLSSLLAQLPPILAHISAPLIAVRFLVHVSKNKMINVDC